MLLSAFNHHRTRSPDCRLLRSPPSGSARRPVPQSRPVSIPQQSASRKNASSSSAKILRPRGLSHGRRLTFVMVQKYRDLSTPWSVLKTTLRPMPNGNKNRSRFGKWQGVKNDLCFENADISRTFGTKNRSCQFPHRRNDVVLCSLVGSSGRTRTYNPSVNSCESG